MDGCYGWVAMEGCYCRLLRRVAMVRTAMDSLTGTGSYGRGAMDWFLWMVAMDRLLWTVAMEGCYGLVAMDSCYGLVAMEGCDDLVTMDWLL